MTERVLVVFLAVWLLGGSCRSESERQARQEPKRPTVALTGSDTRSPLGNRVNKGGRGLLVRVQGADDVEVGDHLDLLFSLADPQTQQVSAFTGMSNVYVLQVDRSQTKHGLETDLTVSLLPQEAEVVRLAAKLGAVHASLRNAGDLGSGQEAKPVVVENLVNLEDVASFRAKRTGLKPAEATHLNVAGRLSEQIPRGGRALHLAVQGGRHVRAGDRVDLLATFKEPNTGQWACATLLEQVAVLRVNGESDLTVLVLPEEAVLLILASRLGDLCASLRNPKDEGLLQYHARTTVQTLFARPRKLGSGIRIIKQQTTRSP